MENKNISVFVESFVPDFVNQEHPDFVIFLKNYLKYIERYNEVKSFPLLSIEDADYDPEQDGTFYQGVYFNLNYGTESEDLIRGLSGSLIKGSVSNAIYQVEDVVFSVLDSKYLLKVKPTTSKIAMDGETFSEVDIGEYTQIANLLLFRDIDESIDEFIAEHSKEYLSGLPANLSSDVKNLIKNIRSYYKSKGTEQSFRFLFRAIWGSEISFYFPKVDILRVSDGNWYQPYFIELVDDTNISDFENLSIAGATSGTRADVEDVIFDFQNATTVSEFFTWSNLSGLVEESNGLRKTNAQGWNTTALSQETGFEDFGAEVEIPNSGYRFSLTLMPPNEPLSTGIPGQVNGFSIASQSGSFLAYYNGTQFGGLFDSYVGGDIVALKENNGQIALLKNGNVIFTFPQAVPSELAFRPNLLTAGAATLENIRNTSRGQTISVPKFLEVTIQEGELLVGENVTDIRGSGTTAQIDTITQQDGFWTDDDGKLSSTKVLQDNYFYQDFSYVIQSEVSIELFEDVIRKINHPAGFLLFGEFLGSSETILEVNLSTFDSNFGLKSLEELLAVNLSIENITNQLTTELASSFFGTTYRIIDENKEDHPWDILFDTSSQFDNVDLSPFTDTPDAPSYIVPDSTLIINTN